MGLYALSAIWSVWAAFTVFRVIELGGFWILTVHLFSGRSPLARLTWCLLAAAMLLVFCGVVSGWPEYNASQIFGRYPNNQNGMFAGALVVIILARLLIMGEKRSLILLLPSFIAFVLFGSLSSAIALFFALLTLLLLRFGWGAWETVAQLLIVGLVLPLVAFVGYGGYIIPMRRLGSLPQPGSRSG